MIPYAVIFWVIAVVSTITKSVRENEITFQKEWLSKIPTPAFMVIKFLPAVAAAIVVLLFRPTNSLFYILLAVAFIFCFLGDIGMEIKLLVGGILFLIAQILFIGNFIWQSIFLGVSFLPIAAFITAFIAWLLVIIFNTHFIDSSDNGFGTMKIPITVYSITVSLTFCSALMLWLATGVLLGFIPVLGAFFFVVSDLTLFIKEFHHHFNKAELFIFPTYYLALFLLSLSIIVLIF
ncbi:MAG: lysoplasmalogenase family protein [Promethearchaeota archaeon]